MKDFEEIKMQILVKYLYTLQTSFKDLNKDQNN